LVWKKRKEDQERKKGDARDAHDHPVLPKPKSWKKKERGVIVKCSGDRTARQGRGKKAPIGMISPGHKENCKGGMAISPHAYRRSSFSKRGGEGERI